MPRRKSVNFVRDIGVDARFSSPLVQKFINIVMERGKKSLARKIVYEACFTNNYCPNGKSFQEGAGSAVLTPTQLKAVDALHGTQMLSGSILTNPNTKFVYIRAYGIDKNGYLNSPVDSDFLNILNWINTNKIKYKYNGKENTFYATASRW